MFNLDDITNKNDGDHNKNGYIFLIIHTECSGLLRTNVSLNLINERDNDNLIDKI